MAQLLLSPVLLLTFQQSQHRDLRMFPSSQAEGCDSGAGGVEGSTNAASAPTQAHVHLPDRSDI